MRPLRCYSSDVLENLKKLSAQLKKTASQAPKSPPISVFGEEAVVRPSTQPEETPLQDLQFIHKRYLKFGNHFEYSTLKQNTATPLHLPFSQRKPNSYLDIFKACNVNLKFSHKNTYLLSQFLSPTGLILPTRLTTLSKKTQRQITKNIHRARCMGLLPPLSKPCFIMNEE